MTVPWTQNQVIISDLQPGAEYDVTVRISTAAGMSGITILCKNYSIQSMLFPECTAPVGADGRISMTTPASSNSDNTVAIIGGVVAVVVVITIVIAITILIAIALVLRSRRAEFSPHQKYITYQSTHCNHNINIIM